MKMKIKLIIIIIAFLDILGIGIFVPILPELAKYFDVNAGSISFALVVYSLFSFVASPILGQLSDKYGRKIILLISIFGAFLSNLVIIITDLFIIFLLARAISGFVGGNITVLQSMLSDISKDKKERVSNLGVFGALFGLAFIIGPIFGSILINYGIKAPFIFITILAFIGFLISFFFLEETIKQKSPDKKMNVNPFKTISKQFKNCNIQIYLISFFLLILSTSMFKGMLPVFLDIEFSVSVTTIGYIMAGVGIVVFISQMVLLKKVWLKYFQLHNLFLIVNIMIFTLYLILSQLNSLNMFILFFYILIIFTSIINPIYAGEIVESTGEHDRGEIMGVLTSLVSVTMFIGPIIAGTLIDLNINIFIGAAIITIISLILLPRLYNFSK